MLHQDVNIHVPGFHPGWQVANSTFVGHFLLGNDNSPSTEAGSSERRRVKEGDGLTPFRAGYKDSDSCHGDLRHGEVK